MHFKKLFMASLALNQLIHSFSKAQSTHPILGFENASPDNTWVLKSTGDDLDYITTHYQLDCKRRSNPIL